MSGFLVIVVTVEECESLSSEAEEVEAPVAAGTKRGRSDQSSDSDNGNRPQKAVKRNLLPTFSQYKLASTQIATISLDGDVFLRNIKLAPEKATIFFPDEWESYCFADNMPGREGVFLGEGRFKFGLMVRRKFRLYLFFR